MSNINWWPTALAVAFILGGYLSDRKWKRSIDGVLPKLTMDVNQLIAQAVERDRKVRYLKPRSKENS